MGLFKYLKDFVDLTKAFRQILVELSRSIFRNSDILSNPNDHPPDIQQSASQCEKRQFDPFRVCVIYHLA